MRNLGLAAIALGAFYLWPHLKYLIAFWLPRGLAWVWSAVLAAALLFSTALFKSVLVGFYLYVVLCFLITDIIWICLRLFKTGEGPARAWRRIYAGGLLPVALALMICVLGYFNAKTIRVTQYTVDIEKPLQGTVRIALISDVHLGTSIKSKDLPGIVEKIQNLRPDLIFLGGDIYEEATTEDALAASYAAFSKLSAPLGVYYVPGNHEYSAQENKTLDLGAVFASLRAAGVTPLRDRAAEAGGMTVIGRDDPRSPLRAPLAALMKDTDVTRPVIVMDHEPIDLGEAERAGVDLQLSGHTHAGQLFPAGELTELFGIFTYSYGWHRQGGYQVIVSSGAGTWGFPMRVGSPSEIVLVTLHGATEGSDENR